MGAVAAGMRERGFVVTGQDDNVYPPMSTFLEEKGISITKGFEPADIPATADLVAHHAADDAPHDGACAAGVVAAIHDIDRHNTAVVVVRDVAVIGRPVLRVVIRPGAGRVEHDADECHDRGGPTELQATVVEGTGAK